MEQRHNLTRIWIDARKIGALKRVAPVASQSEIVVRIVFHVLFRNDVLNLEKYKRSGSFQQKAVAHKSCVRA